MTDWNAVSTAFLVGLAVALPLLFALYVFLQLAIANIRNLIAETLNSEVVQAIAGAASQVSGKKELGGGSVKSIVASKGMDIVGRLLGMQ